MAAVRDTAEEACALRRAEGTLGLYNAEDGFFHVLSPKRLALGEPSRGQIEADPRGVTPSSFGDELLPCSLQCPVASNGQEEASLSQPRTRERRFASTSVYAAGVCSWHWRRGVAAWIGWRWLKGEPPPS